MITLANIRRAIYCINKRLDLLEGGGISGGNSSIQELQNKVSTLESLISEGNNPTQTIDKFNEIVAFLDSIKNTETLSGIIGAIQQDIGSIQNSLPTVMGGSGNGHKSGLVPDPGATAGTTKYLREDGTWTVPSDNTTPESIGFGIGTCSTAAGTAAKVVTLANYELVTNGFVAVSFENDVPANATLNINGRGAKPIYYKGEAIVANAISGGDTVTFVYDGTNYVVATPLRLSKVTIRTWSDNAKTTPIAGVLSVTLPGRSVTTVRTGSGGTATLYSIDGNATLSCSGALSDISSFIVNGDTTVDIVLTNINYVDMGTGILWATKNIDHQQQDGFATSDRTYTCSYFDWGNGHVDGHKPGDGYDFNITDWRNTEGAAIGNKNFDINHDSAHRHCGGDWRTPTKEELKELFEKCNYIDGDGVVITGSNKLTTLYDDNNNPVVGIRLRPKDTNFSANTLFFPACGVMSATTLGNVGTRAVYLSSTSYADAVAYQLLGQNTFVDYQSIMFTKAIGMTLRPVM